MARKKVVQTFSALEDKSIGTIDPVDYKSFDLTKYYTPSLSEFKVGFIYEYFVLDKWLARVVTDDDFEFRDGHSEMMNIAYNLNVVKKRKVRVKYLCAADFESLDFDVSYVNGIFVYTKLNLCIEHDPSKCVVRMKVDDAYVFRGQILNLSELKDIFVKVGVVQDENRLSKIEGVKNENR